jgi:UDP-galactopyranose mutase
VVSTSVRDVVRPYGEQDLVAIADTPERFVEAVQAALTSLPQNWRDCVDRFLATKSWDRTWAEMAQMINEIAERNITTRHTVGVPPPTPPGDASVKRPPGLAF